METIRVVVDAKLLQATDRAARRTKLEIQELEERDRKGYEVLPSDKTAAARWEAEAVFLGQHRL